MRTRELFNRNRIMEDGVWKAVEFSMYEQGNPTLECDMCKYDCYLSALVCPCDPKRIVCLDDAHKICNCPPENKILLFRYTTEELNKLVDRVGCNHANHKDKITTESLYSEAKEVSSVHTLGRTHLNAHQKKRKVIFWIYFSFFHNFFLKNWINFYIDFIDSL